LKRLVPSLRRQFEAEGVPVPITGMMKIMTGFNPKSITSDTELAELFKDYYEIHCPEPPMRDKQVFRRIGSPIIDLNPTSEQRILAGA